MLDILHPNISNINKNNIDINLSEEKIKINNNDNLNTLSWKT